VLQLRTKSIVLIVATLALVAVAVAGCGTSSKTGKSGSELSGSLRIGGSTTVLPLAQAGAEEFMAKNPNVKVEVQGTGSSEGITGVTEGTLDIGNSSRELKPEEKGLVDHKVAIDAIAIIVNPANGVSKLTDAQVKGVLSGKITNWKEVGGKNAKIQVVGRDEASGTRDYVQKDIIGEGAKFPADALAMPGTGQLKAAVAQTPDAIGYMSAAQADNTVKVLKVDNFKPSPATVNDKTYKYWRYLHMFTKGEAKGLAKAYIDFVLSSGFQKDTVSKEFYTISQ
jgi:phosphate transport system substrate-binding protein